MLNFSLFLFIGTLGWGISLYLIKILLVCLTPTEIVLYRTLLGALSLFMLAKLLRLRSVHFKALVCDGLVVGLFNVALPLYLTSLAEKTVPSALASVLNGLTPLCTFLWSFCFLTERPKMRFFNVLSLTLGLLGISLVHLDHLKSQGSLVHLLALMATCFSYGFVANYVKNCLRTQEPILVAAMASAVSALLMLFFQLYTHASLSWGYPTTLAQGSALLWLGVISTGLSLYLYCLLIKRLGAVNAVMVTYLMTVTGVLMGVVFLGEKMSTLVILGCCCVIISLLLTNHAASFERFYRGYSLRALQRV